MAHGIVGRDREVDALQRFVADDAAGPAALLIEGEPGIGKTTLFDGLLRMARERGHQLLVCRPARSEMDLSYLGLVELLEGVDQEVIRALPAPQARVLKLVLRRAEGRFDRLSLNLALSAVIRTMAEARPLLIAIDDHPWLDHSTGRALAYVFRRLGGTRARVALVSRFEDRGGWPFELDRALGVDRLVRMRLEPMDSGDLSRMLRAKLGWAPRGPLMLRVAEVSGGNPFYALEIARTLREGEGDEDIDQRLPASLTDLVRSRLAKLPRQVRDLVGIASILQSPTVATLRRLAPPGLDIQAALAAAERAEVLTQDGERIRFAHPILASAVHAAVPTARRLELHRAAAQLPDDIEERARHLAIAAEGPDAEVAVALETAAEGAWRRGAPDASAFLLRTACRLTPPADRDALALRRAALGRLLYQAGDAPGAVAELDSLIAELPPGPIRARALYHLMYVGRSARGMEQSVAYGLQAAEESADDPAFQAEVYEWLSRHADHDSELKLRTARMGLKAVAQVADPDPEVAFYARAALVEAEFHAGMGIHLELLEDAPEDPKPRFPPVRTAVGADDLIGRLLAYAGRIDEGRQALQGLHDRAAVENRSILPAVLGWMSALELLAGRFAEAAARTQEAMGVVEETGNAGVLSWMLGHRAMALTALGRLDEAEAAAAQGVEMAAADPAVGLDQGNARLGLALVAMARGQFVEAAGHLRELEGVSRAIGMREPRWSGNSAELVEALIGAGELDEAGEVLARFEEDAETSGGEWSLASSARCRALLLAACGDLDQALEAADRSLRELGDLPFRFERARCLQVKGQIHRRRKEKRLADQALRDALVSFEEMGTPLWAEKARAELGRLGLRPHAPAQLTETERRVAELAARGLTSKEIAAAAFIAPKTVSNVLGRVYRKLGIDSRAELGAVMSGKVPRDR